VRKSLRYAGYVLFPCLSLMLLLDILQRIKIHRFYVDRPILHAMGSVHDGVWSNGSNQRGVYYCSACRLERSQKALSRRYLENVFTAKASLRLPTRTAESSRASK
jgi:hypothetical protein